MRLNNIPGYLLLMAGLRDDQQAGFRVLTTLAKRLLPRYRFTWPEIAWFEDPELVAVLRRFDEEDGFNAHRRFTLMQFLRLLADVPGDTAECGVFKAYLKFILEVGTAPQASAPATAACAAHIITAAEYILAKTESS